MNNTIDIPHNAVRNLNPKSTRTDTYQYTVNADANGDQIFRDVQKQAKIFNAEQRVLKLKNPDHVLLRKTVARQARLGRQNPNAWRYQERNQNSWRNAYQRIEWDHAAHFDIYVTVQKWSAQYSYWTYVG
jgi:hypothetical protein